MRPSPETEPTTEEVVDHLDALRRHAIEDRRHQDAAALLACRDYVQTLDDRWRAARADWKRAAGAARDVDMTRGHFPELWLRALERWARRTSSRRGIRVESLISAYRESRRHLAELAGEE